MSSDGSGQTRLTSDPGADQAPNFSPDGTRIAFNSNRTVPNDLSTDDEIWTMGADGSGLKKITFDALPSVNPAFSPDGTKIAYDRGDDHEILVKSSDGSGPPTPLTASGSPDFDPDWQPIPTPKPPAPPTPPAPPLELMLTAKKTQKASKLKATLTCSLACEATIRGRGRLDGKSVSTKKVATSLAADTKTKLRLKLSKVAARRIADRKAKLKLKATATAGGERVTLTRKVKVRG